MAAPLLQYPAQPVHLNGKQDSFERHSILMMIFSHRPCFICGCESWCKHREPEVEWAYLTRKSE